MDRRVMDKRSQTVAMLRRARRDIGHTDVDTYYTGKYADATSLYADPAVGLDAGYIWIRRDGGRAETRAVNVARRAPLDKVNISVRAGISIRSGELEIIEVDMTTAIAQLGENAYLVSETPVTVPERYFEPGMLNYSGLTVWSGAFDYYDSAGARKRWLGGNVTGRTVSVTAPATAASWKASVITLNPDATTPTLAAYSTADLSSKPTPEYARTLTIPHRYYIIGMVILYTGDTTPCEVHSLGDWRMRSEVHNYTATVAPGTGDDSGDGYGVGSNYYDITNDEIHDCIDPTATTAIWYARPKTRRTTLQTTDATVTTIASIAVAESTAITITGRFKAAKSDYSAAIGGRFYATCRRASGGNVTLVGSAVVDSQEDSGGTPALTIDVDTGTQTARMRAQGIAAETWNWTMYYETV